MTSKNLFLFAFTLFLHHFLISLSPSTAISYLFYLSIVAKLTRNDIILTF
jgi:hypothetical protein